MRGLSLGLALLLAAPATALAGGPSPGDLSKARALMKARPLIDGHNDLPWQIRERFHGRLSAVDLRKDLAGVRDGERAALHTDLVRLVRGGVGGVFWSVYVPVDLGRDEAVRVTLEQIDVARRIIDAYPAALELALTADDVERIHRSGRVASLIGMEGGHSIGNSLGALRMMYALGARYMTITHWQANDWADAATAPPRHDGLSPFGEEVIREMNRLGMLVDLSHVSVATMNDALDVSVAPVIFSHSSASARCDHPRNVPDAVLERLVGNGGVVMITFVPSFVSCRVRAWSSASSAERERLAALHPGAPDAQGAAYAQWRAAHPEPRATLSQVVDHIVHVIDVAGIDHVGLGSDFDGVSSLPVGLEDVSAYPALVAELLRRGYDEAAVAKIIGGNVLRAMRRAEAVAQRLQRERGPSEVRFDPKDASDPKGHPGH